MSTWRGVRRLLWPREQTELFQAAALRRLIAHAYRNVPYYRKLFDDNGVDPREIRSADDLARVPITSREDLQAQRPEAVVARGLDARRLIELRTSGSAGKPLIVRRTWQEQILLHGFLLRANRYFGLRPRDRMAGISFIGDAHPRDRKVFGKTLRKLGIFRVTRLNAASDPDDLLRLLEELQPEVITAYPSVLNRLAGHLAKKGGATVRPRFLMTGAEVLTPHHRLRITGAFGAPVYDVYSSCEFHILGWECKGTGALHTSDDSVVVEVVADGQPVAPGEEGEVVGTALHSYAMPIIRYRLGDVVVRGADRCGCGAPYATITTVQGRVEAYINLPGGGRVHAAVLDRPIRTQAPGWMAQYQYVQERLDLIVLQVVPAAPPPAGRVQQMKQWLGSLLGDRVQVEIRLVDEIPAGAGGKHRYFISNV